jgi:hypothetical protein
VYIYYGRYSGEGQRGNSSVERQIDANVEHYRNRAKEIGLPLVERPYFDDAKSGFHGDNLEAELGKIFADIKSGALPPGSVIGTESHSRLGRLSANDALYQYLDIIRVGIKLDRKDRALRTWESIGGMTGVLVLMEISWIWCLPISTPPICKRPKGTPTGSSAPRSAAVNRAVR